MSKLYTIFTPRSSRWAMKVSRRDACSIMLSTGSLAFASVSSEKYIRVFSPMLMPRATIQKFTCGAIGRPLRPETDEVGPGPAPAAETLVNRLVLAIGGVIVLARSVRLPDLQEHVPQRQPQPIKD